jgi:hypothetical protein
MPGQNGKQIRNQARLLMMSSPHRGTTPKSLPRVNLSQILYPQYVYLKFYTTKYLTSPHRGTTPKSLPRVNLSQILYPHNVFPIFYSTKKIIDRIHHIEKNKHAE